MKNKMKDARSKVQVKRLMRDLVKKTQIKCRLPLILLCGVVFFPISAGAVLNEISQESPKTSFQISNSLRLGDSGEGVLKLQKLLNTRKETRVAENGPGSPGNETYYFGPLTKIAVIKFQELYQEEILLPIGLSEGTGYVGTQTIKKMNSLSVANSYEVSDTRPAEKTTQPPVPATKESIIVTPKIFSVTPSHATAGTLLTLNGEGFDRENNIIYASFAKLENIPSEDGKTLRFVVKEPFPDNLFIPDFLRKKFKSMQYGFYVENKNGKTANVLFTLDLIEQ